MFKERGAAGFTVKSGWACAVLIAGTAAAPRIVDSRRVEISDPDISESTQPYHAGFGTARESGDKLKRLMASVKRYGRKLATITSAFTRWKEVVSRSADRGDRAEHKAAALAAWISLSGRH